MVLHALTWLLALVAVEDKGPVGVHVTTATAAERIPLSPLRGPIDLVADPYGGRIELRTQKPQPALAAQVSRHAGMICPTVKLNGSVIELTCRTRRFEALLSSEGGKKFLDIQELRGLPWREGAAGPPFYHYEPFRTGLGSICPGRNAVSRGECALLAGRQLQAATEFRSAVETGDGQMAALRLGDLALGTGDPATAIGWYRRAGSAGIFGRMARARICELEGSCLDSTAAVQRVLDPRGLPGPLRAEMTVRAVRAEALEGRLGSATRILWQMIRGGSLGWMCREGGELICRRVLLEYMREATAGHVNATQPAKEPSADVPAEPAAEVASPTRAAEPPTAPVAASGSDVGTVAATPPPAASATVAKNSPGAASTATTIPDHDAGAPVAVVEKSGTPTPTPTPTGVSAPDSDGEPTEAEMAFEVYLSLPAWDHGPLAPELSEAAADLANHLGAPVFGGNILSAVAPGVEIAMLPAHLLRAAELYLDGDDIARTRLVIEYARTRVGKRMTGRWVALERRLAARVASEEESAMAPPLKINVDATEVSRELAAARAVLARAQVARAETAPKKKQGDKP